MISPQPILDFDQWYARLARDMARLCGALIAGLGVLVAGIYLRFQNSEGPLEPTDTTPALVMGVALIITGVILWWMAAGGPWLLFDRLMVRPFIRSNLDHSRPSNIILWWETRRLPYNLIVGTAGLLSSVISFTIAGISESRGGGPVGMPDGIFILAAPILFGIGANMCYTGGWIVELLIRRVSRVDLRKFASSSFAWGLAVSVGIAFLPAILASIYLFGLLTGMVHPSLATAP